MTIDPNWAAEQDKPVPMLPQFYQDCAETISAGESCPSCGSCGLLDNGRIRHLATCNYARTVLDPL